MSNNFVWAAVVFLVIGAVSAALGSGGVTGSAMEGAQTVFYASFALFVLALVAHYMTERRV
jgi:uncharacterized membrane protein YtjA (UPF0391 family)